ncbi:hypothetical protein [Gimesia maris]|uniref:Uncharacterized protein n=1 Tax=Gimesia maris TaxID=122 RepID=A0ABX5YMX0_9PLAN|nr:hypothetical protein [Gimesia maris]EDL59004.1 hypothetical protein PM8797T_30192 [Gimesia maris DSM 8797]QEG16947.1 hypothetical protein GmarT_28180 [Gimesia maris]QGQ29923.1 hypothetical protein F1729_15420 [Gimesia maris]
MEYNLSYHVTCNLKQDSGRELILNQLEQSQSYAGMMEGVPNKKANDWGIDVDLCRAVRREYTLGEPYLIPPRRRDYLREPGDMDEIRKQKSHYPKEWVMDPEWLPLICCIGCFKSVSPVRNTEMHGSCLTVVWYQDDYAMPIDPEVIRSLKQLDWDRLATDFEY